MSRSFFFGFSHWKHNYIRQFLPEIENVVFINPLFKKNHLQLAIKKGLCKDSHIYIWGRKSFQDIEEHALRQNISISRIEDGFIRSVSLGSDLTQPYSLVLDNRGIYFDPTQESDLEYILNITEFDEELLSRAKKVKEYLLEKKISKYNVFENSSLDIPKDKKIVLVPGQVEDDASIQYGANGMTNLELLRQTRQNASDAFIIFKPHPDVLVGNRVGDVPEDEALKYCDKVVTEVGIDAVLDYADEVHTMTSLVGFESLMRGKKVYTYGIPFYAGWGLTQDAKSCSRRKRLLSLDQLVAATLILYPRYFNIYTQKLCEIEDVLEIIEKERELYKNPNYRRKVQFRNFISRKSQLLLRMFKALFS